MDIEIAATDPIVLVNLTGELNATTEGTFIERCKPLALAGQRFIINCAQVTACDARGLRAMKKLSTDVYPEGTVAVVQPSIAVSRLLDFTGLD